MGSCNAVDCLLGTEPRCWVAGVFVYLEFLRHLKQPLSQQTSSMRRAQQGIRTGPQWWSALGLTGLWTRWGGSQGGHGGPGIPPQRRLLAGNTSASSVLQTDGCYYQSFILSFIHFSTNFCEKESSVQTVGHLKRQDEKLDMVAKRSWKFPLQSPWWVSGAQKTHIGNKAREGWGKMDRFLCARH